MNPLINFYWLSHKEYRNDFDEHKNKSGQLFKQVQDSERVKSLIPKPCDISLK